jgi:hypothetical protein
VTSTAVTPEATNPGSTRSSRVKLWRKSPAPVPHRPRDSLRSVLQPLGHLHPHHLRQRHEAERQGGQRGDRNGEEDERRIEPRVVQPRNVRRRQRLRQRHDP